MFPDHGPHGSSEARDLALLAALAVPVDTSRNIIGPSPPGQHPARLEATLIGFC
jgi:hypothetical protein